MKDHEIFQTGVYNEIDGIVLNDLFDFALYASYIENAKSSEIEEVELQIEGGSISVGGNGSPCVFLKKEEVDAMIGFLTFVRSKMG